MTIELFISHSHKDSKIATQLIRLIEGCVKVKDGSIRCTSVEGYGLKTGATPNVQLLNELKDSKVVVGILSPNSIRDAWPLSEMGCAWGLERKPICFLVGGLTHKDVEGPLSGTINTIASDRNSIVDFIATVREGLGAEATDERKGEKAKRDFMEYIASASAFKFYNPTMILHRKEITDQDKYGLRWGDLFAASEKRVLIWGLSLRDIMDGNHRNRFDAMAKSGKKLDLLIMDHQSVSESKLLNFGPICAHTADQVIADIEDGERKLKSFRDRLDKDAGTPVSRVSLRKTNIPMSWSGVAIDHAEDHGRLQIEMYNYDNVLSEDHLRMRANIVLNRSSPFYEQFARSIDLLWDSGKPF